MLLVSICYILMAVGVPKILNFFSSNISILLNVSIGTIQFGLTVGSIGGFVGKAICEFFIKKYKYTHILSISFLLSLCCFSMEFLNIIPLDINSFYLLRIIQGFFSGLIYSTILANLGEFYSGEQYKNFLSIITGSFGLAGPLFALLWIVWDFNTLVGFLIICGVIGALLSFFTVQNTVSTYTYIDKQKTTESKMESKSLSYYINLLWEEKSIFAFSLSFAFSLMGSVIILSNTTRLLILYLQQINVDISYIYIKAISAIPLIFGSLFFIPKKKESNYIRSSLLILLSILLYFLFKNIIFCFFTLVFVYGVHLILIPVGSSLILNKQQREKAYYSYIIHAVRSLYSIIIQIVYLKYLDIYCTSFSLIIIFLLVINLLSFSLYFYGKYLLYWVK